MTTGFVHIATECPDSKKQATVQAAGSSRWRKSVVQCRVDSVTVLDWEWSDMDEQVGNNQDNDSTRCRV
jgi:hypothetical protein